MAFVEHVEHVPLVTGRQRVARVSAALRPQHEDLVVEALIAFQFCSIAATAVPGRVGVAAGDAVDCGRSSACEAALRSSR